VVIVPQNAQPDSTGGFYPAVAAKGAGARLAWHASVGVGETQLQRVDGTVLVGDAIVIADATPGGRAEKALAHVGDRWWMGVQHVGVAVESFWLSDAAVLSQDVLVPYPSCGEDCVVGIDVPNLLAVTWQDDLWFGFWDYTESSVLPYRIVRVKEGCVYLPMYDAVKQR
ncbi:MAG: hypothetical protein HY744_14370, partial [Deltaproteobacteria bacterium]|nr:hypothetical protein [Deltaproteobacteria bacterium]